MRALFVILLIVFAGCWNDAEHLNPLDPLSPEFENAGSLDGVVQDRAFNPIPNAAVLLSPGGRTATTGVDGRFRFDDLAPGDYIVALTGSGLQPSSDAVTIQLGKTAATAYTMNILPWVAGVSVATVHVSRWWPQADLYRLDVLATAADGDGLVDIASVTLGIPHLGFSTELNPTQDPGVFGIALTEDDLNGTSLHSLMGKEMNLGIRDQPGAIAVSDPMYISRIIDQEPETTSPSGSQEVPGGTPLLTWPASGVPFIHTYQIDVYRVDDDIATNVYSDGGIPESQFSYQITATLATGQYYWTLSVVDEYGNRSRSKEAGFIVP